MYGNAEDIAQIEELEDRRYEAMLAADIDILDTLLHEDMIYAHSTGGMDSKEVYLAALRDEVTIYQRVERSEKTVSVTGDIGLAYHHIEIDARHKGKDLHLDNLMLAVWTREDGVWRLLAIHSGAVPPSRK